MRLGHFACAALLVAAVGCKKSDDTSDTKATGKTTPASGSGKASASASGTGSASASASGSGSASASASGTGSASASGSGTAAAGAMTGAEMAKQVSDCWGYFNSRDWDKFKACHNADATSEDVDAPGGPKKGADAILADAKDFVAAFSDAKGEIELQMVSDNHVVNLIEITGTNDGPLKGDKGVLPATKKKIGLLVAQVVDIDTKTKAASGTWSWIDQATMLAQLGIVPGTHADPAALKPFDTKDVVVASGSDAEKKNLDTHHTAMDAWNKHDIAALEANRADDATWFEASAPQGMDKKTMEGALGMLWKAFPDIKLTAAGEFAAGDYLVHYGLMEGTNSADMGAQKATGKKISVKYMHVQHFNKDGKVDKGWIFTNNLAMMMQMGAPGGK